ncbi:uncharacterized protein BHQ10_004563 [Talaromyces amestolkiae]|uniref:Endonuclease/exonuclease/phosphatase domain-containing protein n=1 Tax=Talaromyces amestolkiae TaxID=1196081 RepID=A0A364KYI8_TALAM|nr:uncharacterized protein BHQ10_004563 [Talaromyces amestolkiae]RAO68551.1 hypothetical protein BHQ10_004563 [Talaromyces amestolkiae]
MEQLTKVADLILQIIQSKSSEYINKPFIKAFAQQIKDFAIAQGEHTDILVKFKGLLKHIKSNITIVCATTTQISQSSKESGTSTTSDSTIFWKTHQAQAWQAAIQSASSPQSQSASSSTPRVSHVELGMDSEIVVKIRDDSERAHVKKLQPKDIVDHAERARAHAAKSTPSLALAGHGFKAARQLSSDNISLRASHAAGAEVLRKHAGSWVTTFSKSAYVRVPTWGIVINGIPVRHVERSEEFKQELAAENTNWGQPGFEVEIAYVGWLTKPRGYSGSLIVEFTSPVVANNAIASGTVWRAHSLTNRPYYREGRVKMCRKCQHYGHVQVQCPNQKYICGLCADEHPTWECPSKQNRNIAYKCANCKGSHKAASADCETRQRESTRARQVVSMGTGHRVPQFLQARMIKHMASGPTPAEAAQITKKTTQAQKKAVKKTTTKGKKATTTAESMPESTQAPIREAAPIPESAHEPEAAVPTIEQPPVQGPAKAVSFQPEKRSRGRPPKSKSSTNEDEAAKPQEYIDTALIASQLATINPAQLSNHSIAASTAPALTITRKSLRSRGLNQPVDMRNDPEQPLREQRRRERTQSQSYDNTPLPPLPPMDMNIDNQNVVLNSAPSYQEIDSGELNSNSGRALISTLFEILQYNTHKSKDKVMATFLHDPEVLKASIIAIQEPWRNEYDDTTHQPARMTHQLLHPKAMDGVRARMALYINKKIDPAMWTHTTVSPDYQILHLQHLHNETLHNLYIHNIYNNTRLSTFDLLHQELTQIRHSLTTEHLVLGDMNIHHPAWGGPGTRTDSKGTELLKIADYHDLELATEEGTVTWERGQSKSTINLTFLSMSLFNRLILIERADTIQHDSDHWPIRTRIDIQTPIKEPPQRQNWKATDMEKLTKILECDIMVPDLGNTSKSHIELTTIAFTSTIRHAIDQSVPWAKPSEWSNPDFTPEYKEAVRTCRRLRHLHSNTHNPWIWRAYLRAQNHKKRLVSKSLRLGHRRRVQQATEQGPLGLWRLAKWAHSRKGAYESGITPTLKAPNGDTAESVEDKTALLSEAFFPQIPEADLSDISNAEYPEQLSFPEIPRHEIERVIHSTPPDKAPGEDSIPNSFWHLIVGIPVVLDTLYQIYNTYIQTGYNPSHFQQSITVVLRKAGTDRDYTTPKAYRPVALLNTIGKFLEAIVARRISYAMESEGLLPQGHLRGRAYDNAHHLRLLHNMRKQRLGHFVPWVTAFLTGRSTKIRIPEGISDTISTPTGIPQGSPISPILYLIYNSDLVEDCADPPNQVFTSGWVDNMGMIAAGYSENETIEKLQHASAIADQWALRHASVFDKKKYQLIHFMNPRSDLTPNSQPIILQDSTIRQTSNAVKYLRIWLDSKLTFETHREKAVAKAGTSLEALRGLAGSTWGAALGSMRRIYQAIVIPQMLYSAAAWYQLGNMAQSQLTKIT